VRGGAAGRVPAGGAVFRVRRIGDIALLVVQWGLVACGLYLMLDSVHLFALGALSDGDLPLPGTDYFVIPVYQRLVQSLTSGLIALGLGAGLFYLRRIYLARS
jgi:hypothetical protein